MIAQKSCPCCSGKTYGQCCALFHEGAPAETPLQLMRSRYSAYALGNAEYIIQTTHPNNPQYQKDKAKWLKEIREFCNHTKFEKLEILHFDQDTVTFIAHLKQNGQSVQLKEKSLFAKHNGRWTYL